MSILLCVSKIDNLKLNYKIKYFRMKEKLEVNFKVTTPGFNV